VYNETIEIVNHYPKPSDCISSKGLSEMDALTQWELSVNLLFQSLGTGLYPVMSAITWLGSEYFYILVMALLYWCVDTSLGLRVGFILLLSNSVNSIFKVLFHSPRPYWIDSRVRALVYESSFGLPSGHAQNAMSIWGIIAATIKGKTFWLAGVLILMMGISRIYLGVHFLHDVVLGWLVGALLVALFVHFEKPVVTWFEHLPLGYRLTAAFASALVMIAAAMAVHAITTGWKIPETWFSTALAATPDLPIDPLSMGGTFTGSGTWFGMTAGLALMAGGHGGHDPRGPLSSRILRFLLGIAGLGVIYLGLGLLFPDTPDFLSYVLRFIRYSLVGFWAIWLAPLIFVKLGLAQPRTAV
jgi:membrane-associated phospholipid phosphatase